MVLHSRHFRPCWQQVFEMPFPACRVLTLSVASRFGPIENALNSAADPARGLCFGLPDRLQRLHDQPRVDRLDGQRAEDRIDVCRERRGPLSRVLRVFPARPVRCDVRLGACLERHCRCRGKPCLSPLRVTRFDGVGALKPDFAALSRFAARLRQGHGVQRSQAHFSGPARQHEAVNPSPCPALRDL